MAHGVGVGVALGSGSAAALYLDATLLPQRTSPFAALALARAVCALLLSRHGSPLGIRSGRDPEYGSR